jgi:Tfp pilus assembly protein PilN
MRNIDFLPQAYREARRRHQLRIRRLCLGLATVCLLAVWFGVDEMRLRRTREQLEYLVRQNDTVQAGLQHMAKLQAEQISLLDRCRLIQDMESPISCVTTLQRVAELLPEHVVLRQLQLRNDTAGAVVSEAAQTARTKGPETGPLRMVVTGLAPSQVDIAVLVGRLSGCRGFANVRLEYTKGAELGLHQVQEFRVTFDVLAVAEGVPDGTEARTLAVDTGA